MPHLCRIQLWEKDWGRMLFCWYFSWKQGHLPGSLSSARLLTEITKDPSSRALSSVLELTLRKKNVSTIVSPTCYIRSVKFRLLEDEWLRCVKNVHFVPLSRRLKTAVPRKKKRISQWGHQQRHPVIWRNNEQQHKLNDICLTFCVPFGVLVAAARFHLKSISCQQPWTRRVFPLCLGGCIHQTQVMWSPCCSLSLIPVFSATMCLFVLFKSVCVFPASISVVPSRTPPCTDTLSAFLSRLFTQGNCFLVVNRFISPNGIHTHILTLARAHTHTRICTLVLGLTRSLSRDCLFIGSCAKPH